MVDEKEPATDFDAALRAWAARPAARTPAAAAQQLRRRIEERDAPSGRRTHRWAWTAAGLLAAAGVAGLLHVRSAPLAPPAGEPRAAALAAPSPAGATALAEGQVLIWLDPETPLYMNFAPPAEGPGAGGGS